MGCIFWEIEFISNENLAESAAEHILLTSLIYPCFIISPFHISRMFKTIS